MAKLELWKPWLPVQYRAGPDPSPGTVNKADIAAIKATWAGEADPDQQRRAIAAVVLRICSTNDLSFRPNDQGGSQATEFAEAKRWVGMQIRRLIDTPMADLTHEDPA